MMRNRFGTALMPALLVAAGTVLGACSAAGPKPDGTAAAPPAPVHGVAVEVVSDTSIKVSWTAPDSDVTGYALRWRPGADTDWVEESSVPGTSYTITNLMPNTAYGIQVRAESAGGAGPWSDSITATTADQQALPAPMLVEESVTATSLSVSWTLPPTNQEVAGYRLRWHAASQALADAESEDLVGTALNHTITGLLAGTAYTIQIRALSADREGPWSAPLTITTAPASTNDQAARLPRVSIAPHQSRFSESAGAINFILSIHPTRTEHTWVNLSLAEEGGDILHPHSEGSQVAEIPANRSRYSNGFLLVDDDEAEPDSTVIATVEPGEGYEVGSPASATVTILDDD